MEGKRKVGRERSLSCSSPSAEESGDIPVIRVTNTAASPRRSMPILSVIPSPSKETTKIEKLRKQHSETPRSHYTQSLDSRHSAAYSEKWLRSFANAEKLDYYDSTDDDYNHFQRNLTIKVHINLTQYKLGLPHIPCSLETLGIVPNRYSTSGKSGSFFSLNRRSLKGSKKSSLPVVIRGVIPSTPAALTEQLQPGDEIIRVNGQKVTMKTIEEMLSRISHEVIFDVCKGLPNSSSDHALSPPPTYDHSDTTSPSPPLSHSFPPPPPLLLFLTLDTKEEDPANKDILFCYPQETGQHHVLEQLVQIRGVFLTLSDLMMSSFSNFQCSSCILELEGDVFHVSSHLSGKELILLVLSSASGSAAQVKVMLETLRECLLVLYGDLHTAFQDKEITSTILPSLLTLSFSPNSFLPCPLQQIPLSVKTTSHLSGHLNQLDTASYRSGSLSLLSPVGSCLFYKGYLVSHHLSTKYLRAVHLVCYCHNLLQLSSNEPLEELTVVWRQIFLSEEEMSVFVLVTGMEQTLLCQVLTANQDTISLSLSDDRVKEKSRQVLSDIHSSGLLSDCERRMVGLPALTSADVLLASKFTSSSMLATKGGRQMTRSSTGSIYSLSTIASTGSMSDSDTEGGDPLRPLPRKSSSVFHSFRLSLRRRKNKPPPSMSSHSSLSLPIATREPYMLTAGTENHLLYYVCLEVGRGLLVSPSNEQMSTQPVHSLLLETFRETAATISTILHQKREEQEEDPCNWDDDESEVKQSAVTVESGGPFKVTGCPVLEHGVLMSCTTAHAQKTLGKLGSRLPILNYWVIGRLFDDKELYICYQENMSQTCVEMAFKILFGSNVF